MFDFLAGFDLLGVGAALAGLLLLGWLIWMIVDNRSFDELNERHRRGGRGDAGSDGHDGKHDRPTRPGRAA